MSALLDLGRRLYAALAAGDGDALAGLLADGFEGRLAAGLPRGFGRLYVGRNAMLRDGWGAIGTVFAMRPEVKALHACDELLVGHGAYVGTALPTGRPVRAPFAHFWCVDGDRFSGVEQVTDTQLWHAALEPTA